MGGTLSMEQKKDFCDPMQDLYPFGSPYWSTTLDCISLFSAIISFTVAMKITLNKHL